MSWRLTTERGRQVWVYDEHSKPRSIEWNSKTRNSADLVYRAQCADKYKPLNLTASERTSLPQFYDNESLAKRAVDASLQGINFYSTLQMEDGHWPGDYGGPMFLLPGMIITCYISHTPFTSHQRDAMIRYMFNHQHPTDGGWGLHIEAESTLFGTVLQYVALRLLGIPASDARLVKARSFILKHGGAVFTPSWCKFWLCTLNCMSYEGINSLLPELWLLPEAFPFHPSRWWCHCRMVYMPMAFIYGRRFQCPLDDLITQLREELYVLPYSQMKFSNYKNAISPLDLYIEQSSFLKVVNSLTNLYERWFQLPLLRRRATDFLLSYIHAEDQQTCHIDIGPVNKPLNMLAVYFACGPDDTRFKLHQQRVVDYLWLAEDGMKCQGYNGSQLWDTAFALQALTELHDIATIPLVSQTIRNGYKYADISQVREDVQERVKFFRHISKGGWPFSTVDHGWPITDCTAEGVKATLAIHQLFQQHPDTAFTPTITRQRLDDALNVLLSFQNKDGGFATYELQRSGAYVELINAAEVFSGIMVDYSYVECSSATLQAVAAIKLTYPDHPRMNEIDISMQRCANFIRSIQREDGSWYGSWAVCFTYGCWFGVEGLVASNPAANYHNDVNIRRVCDFLITHRHADGGWGESYRACVEKRWVQHAESQIVNTAWAVLTLLKAGYYAVQPNVIDRAVQLLLSRQLPNGDWPQESISGVFNGNCMISYTNYRNIFPIWAINRYIKTKLKQQTQHPVDTVTVDKEVVGTVEKSEDKFDVQMNSSHSIQQTKAFENPVKESKSHKRNKRHKNAANKENQPQNGQLD